MKPINIEIWEKVLKKTDVNIQSQLWDEVRAMTRKMYKIIWWEVLIKTWIEVNNKHEENWQRK